MLKVVLASSNPGKLREIKVLLDGGDIDLLPLSDFPDVVAAPETGDTFLANALQKAAAVYLATGLPAIADDSGLCVDALDGQPGVYSARYAGDGGDAANNAKLLLALSGVPDDRRGAHFHCTVVLVAASGDAALHGELPAGARLVRQHPDLPEGAAAFTADGKVEGRIAHGLSGEGGFGYDPLFVYEPEGQTFGVLPAELKNRVSHRSQAFRRLAEWLRSIPPTSGRTRRAP